MKITSINLERMTNAYHVAFHQQIEKVITTSGETALGIQAADLAKYRDALTLLQDAVLRTQGSDKTTLLKTLDDQRDNYFRFVRNVLANLKFSNEESKKALYETAHAKILKLYPASVASEGYQEEYAHINGFIVDVRKFFASDLVKLGIKDMLDALEETNDAFQAAYADRAEELSQTETGFTLKCRTLVDEAYDNMTLAINYYASRSDAADEATMNFCSNALHVLPVINEVIAGFQQSIKQSKALRKESVSSNGGSGSSQNGGSSKPSSNGGGGSELN